METYECTTLNVILSYQYVYCMCSLLPWLHYLNYCILFLDKPVNSASQVTGVLLSMLSVSISVIFVLCVIIIMTIYVAHKVVITPLTVVNDFLDFNNLVMKYVP